MLVVLFPDMDSSTEYEGLGILGTNMLSMLVKLADVGNATVADLQTFVSLKMGLLNQSRYSVCQLIYHIDGLVASDHSLIFSVAN